MRATRPAGQRAAVVASFPCTDLGNAERFVVRHGRDVRYVATWGRWQIWDGKRWRLDDTGEVVRRMAVTVRAILAEAQQAAGKVQRKALANWALRSESASRIGAALELAKSIDGIPITHPELDRDPWLLNVENGTLDLRTGELRPHRRACLLTKLAPVVYDPQAECPLWRGLLRRAMAGSEEMIMFLQRGAGYALTGSVREQCLLFFFGAGANGKSTIIETILGLLGDYATMGAADLLTEKSGEAHPTALADLHGARLVVVQETSKGRRWDEALVKRLTGGDTIKARRMREDFWSFSPTHKLFISGNHKPRIRGTDHAIWRRVKVVPFTVTVPESEQDPELLASLRQEWPGILHWAVLGCLAWQQEGRLGFPEEVVSATAAYRAEQDVLASFLADRCKLQAQAKIARADLRRAYEAWCQEAGEAPVSPRALAEALRERGITDGKVRAGGKPVDAWNGVLLKTAMELHCASADLQGEEVA